MFAFRLAAPPGHGAQAKHVQETSLRCLRRDNPVRAACISVVCSAAFDRFMMLVILANTAMLSAYDPRDPGNESTRNAVVVTVRHRAPAELLYLQRKPRGQVSARRYS